MSLNNSNTVNKSISIYYAEYESPSSPSLESIKDETNADSHTLESADRIAALLPQPQIIQEITKNYKSNHPEREGNTGSMFADVYFPDMDSYDEDIIDDRYYTVSNQDYINYMQDRNVRWHQYKKSHCVSEQFHCFGTPLAPIPESSEEDQYNDI